MEKIVLVTGASSGIGAAAAKELAEKGCIVYGLSRRAGHVPGVRWICADVTQEAAARAAVEQILAETGRIDVLVNCAGFGISGAVEATPTAMAQKQLDVNFFGTVRMCAAVIPAMRRSGGGRIVNISSVAAMAPIPFQTFYSAGKAAINSYSMALGNELRPFGISVTAIMPGDIATGFTAARDKLPDLDETYGGRISRSVSRMEHDEQTGMSPAAAGRFVAGIAVKKRVKPLYAIGFAYKAICVLLKILPAGLANRILYLLYAK